MHKASEIFGEYRGWPTEQALSPHPRSKTEVHEAERNVTSVVGRKRLLEVSTVDILR